MYRHMYIDIYIYIYANIRHEQNTRCTVALSIRERGKTTRSSAAVAAAVAAVAAAAALFVDIGGPTDTFFLFGEFIDSLRRQHQRHLSRCLYTIPYQFPCAYRKVLLLGRPSPKRMQQLLQ